MAVDRVVVVGASGNIGTSVLETLSSDPEVGSVLALSRRPPDLTMPKGDLDAGRYRHRPLIGLFSTAQVVIHLG